MRVSALIRLLWTKPIPSGLLSSLPPSSEITTGTDQLTPPTRASLTFSPPRIKPTCMTGQTLLLGQIWATKGSNLTGRYINPNGKLTTSTRTTSGSTRVIPSRCTTRTASQASLRTLTLIPVKTTPFRTKRPPSLQQERNSLKEVLKP